MKRSMLILLSLCLILSLSSALLLMTAAESPDTPTEPSSEWSSTEEPLPVEPSVPEQSDSESSDFPPTEPSSDNSGELPSELSSELSSDGSAPSAPEESGSVSIDWGEVSEEISYAPSRNYTLRVVASQGGKVDRHANGSYAPNEMVKLSAQADEGYVFSRWKSTGGVIANAFSAKTEFYMPVGDAKVEAVFVKKGEESKADAEIQPEEKPSAEKQFHVPYKLTYSIIGLLVFTAAAVTVFVLVYRKKRLK